MRNFGSCHLIIHKNPPMSAGMSVTLWMLITSVGRYFYSIFFKMGSILKCYNFLQLRRPCLEMLNKSPAKIITLRVSNKTNRSLLSRTPPSRYTTPSLYHWLFIQHSLIAVRSQRHTLPTVRQSEICPRWISDYFQWSSAHWPTWSRARGPTLHVVGFVSYILLLYYIISYSIIMLYYLIY